MGEIWNRRANGEAFPERLSISSIYDSDREITNYVAIFHDITDMKLREEQIQHQAYHDALTGLPNRLLVRDRLHMALTKAKRNKIQVTVFYMDLDVRIATAQGIYRPVQDRKPRTRRDS